MAFLGLPRGLSHPPGVGIAPLWGEHLNRMSGPCGPSSAPNGVEAPRQAHERCLTNSGDSHDDTKTP